MKRIVALLLVCVAVGVVFFSSREPRSELSRTNILVGTSPVSVWSWNRQDDSMTLLLIPSDIAADNSTYGRYSLEALWKLGFIDGQQGGVLAQSLMSTLAVPLQWYISERDTLTATTDPKAYGQQLFSIGSAMAYVFGRHITNLPFTTYMKFSFALARVSPQKFQIIDFTDAMPVATETQPDGTPRTFFDTQKVDVILKGLYEDETVGREEQRIAVYNTTAIPSLGVQAARLLSGQGMLIVAVGNSEPEVSKCILEGTSNAIATKTTKIIAELFTCDTKISQDEEQADLRVRLGSEYASQFVSD